MNAITGFSTIPARGTQTAEILACEGEVCFVLEDGHETVARRTFSCLVEPEPGDVVLLGDAGTVRYVLAVLERRGNAGMRLTLPDGATVAADGGRLNLAAQTLVMEATTTQVATGTLGVSATRTEARFGTVSAIADAIETIATRIIGRFRRSYRFVEEGEHLRARDIDQRASGHMALKGDTTTLQAGLVVKIDGAQIHMG